MTIIVKHKYIYEQTMKETSFENKTLEQIVEELGYIKEFAHVAYVVPEEGTANPIDKGLWKHITPKSGEYFVTQVPAGGAFKQILVAVLIAVAVFYGAGWATTTFGAGTPAAAAATAAITVGATVLVNALIPMSIPTAGGLQSGPSESATMGISASQNRVKPGAPVPYHIGTNRIVPPLASQAIREVNGKTVTLKQVFLVGYAPLVISDIRIGDTPITNFKNVEVKINDGHQNTQKIDTIKGTTTSQTNLSSLLVPNVSQIITGGDKAEKAEIVLGFLTGLVNISDQGSFNNRDGDVKVEYRKVGDSTWIPEFASLTDRVDCYRNSTQKCKDQVRRDGTYTICQTAYNSYINFPDGRPASVIVGSQLRILNSKRNNGNYKVFSVSGNKAFVSTVDFREGYWKRDAGDTLEDEVNSGLTVNTTGAAANSRRFTDATTQTTYRTIKIDHLPQAQYEFRITRTNATSTSNRIHDAVTLLDVKTTQLTDDAGELLTAFPPGFAYIGVKIKANDQLNGNINQLSCQTQSVPQVYNETTGNFEETTAGSGNPAWEYLTAMIGDAAKIPLSPDQIDIAEFQSWANRCDEVVSGKPRHSVNHVVDYSTRLDDLLTKIGSIGRSSKTFIDGNYSVIQDVGGRSATQKFTPANSYGFSASKSFVARPDAFRCQFVNPDKDWTIDYIDVWRDDGDTTGTVKEDLDCTGITDVDELYRYAKFAHAQIGLRPEEYTLSTGIENLRSTRGDVIIVSHDKIQGDVSFGRVTAISGATVTLDNGAALTAGSKVVAFRHGIATQPTASYNLVSQSDRVYTLDVDTSTITDLDIGDMCMIGNDVVSVSSKYIIKSIESQSDLSAEMVLLDYADPDLYNSENGVIANYTPTVSKPGINEFKRPVTPIITATYADEKALKVIVGGGLQERIALDVDILDEDELPPPTHVRIGYKPSGTDADYQYEPIQEIIGRTYFCNDVRELSVYDIRVNFISETGIHSDTATVTDITVTGKTNAPDDVTNVIQTKVGAVYVLSWDANTDADLAGYVVYKSGVEFARVTGTSIDLNNVTEGSNTYSVKAFDTSGNVSVTETQKVFVTFLSAPVIVTTESGTSHLIKNADGTINSRVFLSWTTPETVSGYNIRYKLASDSVYTYVQTSSLDTYLENMQSGGNYNIGIQGISETRGITSAYTPIDHEVVGKSQPPSDITSANVTIEDRSLIVSWTAITDADVKEYEIRKGTVWASATFVAKVNSTSWSRPADTTGSHTWLIKAIDTSGLFSLNAKSVELTINPPETPTITAQIIDNNVLLRYQSVAGTLPIQEYEVERGGDIIGLSGSTFSAVFETSGGTYTYNITAIDIAGNRSVTGVHTAIVKSPPDYILNALHISTFSGTPSNSLIHDGFLTLPSSPAGQTWGDYLTATSTYTTLAPEIAAGYTGWLTPTDGLVASYTEIYDYGAILTSSLVSISYETFIKTGSPTIVTKIEASLDQIGWVDYGSVSSVLVSNFRYVRVTTTVTPSDDKEYITYSGFQIKLDSKIANDIIAGTANAGDTGGTSFNFVTPFVDVTSITITPKAGGSAIYGLYDFVDIPNPTSFKVLLFDSTGARASGDFSANIGGFI